MNTMEMIKRTLAFTIGAAEFSAEKLRQFADDMVARGEMSSEEALKFVDDVSKRAEEEKKSIQDWIREQTSRMVQQMGAAEAARVERLEQRVAQIEKSVAELTGKPCDTGDEGVCVLDPTTGESAHGPSGTQ